MADINLFWIWKNKNKSPSVIHEQGRKSSQLLLRTFDFFLSKRSTRLNIYFCFNKKMLGCFKVFLFEVVLLLDVVRQKKLLDNQIKDCEIVGFWLFLKKITVKETKSAMSFSAWNEFKRWTVANWILAENFLENSFYHSLSLPERRWRVFRKKIRENAN